MIDRLRGEKPFRRVAVLKGGISTEREVSLRSGAAVAAGLREAGYTVDEVDITSVALDLPRGVEAAFVALHGAFGEDGQVQALLEQRRIPYTGSGVEASRAAFDKRLSKVVFDRGGIATPRWEVLGRSSDLRLPLPVVVKPPCQGSTIGVHKVSDASQWAAAFDDAARFDGEVLVEDYIPGRELTVGIVGREALPVIEIVAPDNWYDYRAKYSGVAGTQYLVPAPLDEAVAEHCREIGLRTFVALGCRGMGRVDLRMNSSGELFVLELNNLPGFTATSLLPKAAAQAGLAFPELCDYIMRMATLDAVEMRRGKEG